MTTVLHNSTTPSVSVTAVSENNLPQLVATLVLMNSASASGRSILASFHSG